MQSFSKVKKNIDLIFACQKSNYGLSFKGKIPWKCPEDLAFFKKTTLDGGKNAIIMGRKTFDSIGTVLPDRLSIVVTNNKELKSDNPDLIYLHTLFGAMIYASNRKDINKVFVIGGAQIFDMMLSRYRKYIGLIYANYIIGEENYTCDTFVSSSLAFFTSMSMFPSTTLTTAGYPFFYYTILTASNAAEYDYRRLLLKLINRGERRSNRTGVDTFSLFGQKLVFDISDRIPFLTSKKLAWKTMLGELLWFISGSTNNADLQKKGIHIWDGNSTRQYLDSIGLKDREEGDLGPVYGFNWRHFGANYVNCHTDYTCQGFDQLQSVVDLLKKDPNSRRILLSSWNPAVQHLMALPPCHVTAQWYVREGEHLDCQMYQRSADIALGVPFNIASYATLTYMLALVTGLKPGKFYYIMGDVHLYVNHVDAVKEQLDRIPFVFPRLMFTRKVESIDDFKEEDFKLVDYNHHPAIKMDMVV